MPMLKVKRKPANEVRGQATTKLDFEAKFWRYSLSRHQRLAWRSEAMSCANIHQPTDKERRTQL